MRNLKLLPLLALIAGAGSALADNPPPTTDVGILKAKVAPFRPAMDAGIAKARTLVIKKRGASGEISYEQCKEIEKKISDQYPLPVFAAVYKDGSSYSQGCEWNEEHPSKADSVAAGMKYYFETRATKNQFGIQGNYIFRVDRSHNGNIIDPPSEMEIVLDSNYRVIERNWISDNPYGAPGIGDVTAVDANGNLFDHIFDGPLNGKQINFDRAFFTSSDARLNAFYNFGPRRADRGTENVIRRNYNVRQKDWLNASLIPTYWELQFFQYNPNEWSTRPHVYDDLFETSIAETGVEVCADGSSQNGATWTDYKPSDPSDPWTCGNIW